MSFSVSVRIGAFFGSGWAGWAGLLAASAACAVTAADWSRSTSSARIAESIPLGEVKTMRRPSTFQGPLVSSRAPSLVTSQSARAGTADAASAAPTARTTRTGREER